MLSVFKLFLKEWSSIFKSKMMLLSIIGLFFIPILYCGMFLWAFWDPYGHVDKLPVAVVNEDKAAKIDGEEINAGKDLVKELKENQKFEWHFVSEKEASAGIKKHDYYMVITIPSTFSKDVGTLNNKKPVHPTLTYTQDESFNYVASQINKKAAEEIKVEVSNSISKQYANVIFEKIKDASDGFVKAADGSRKVTDGATELHDGTGELLTELKDKSNDVKALSDGGIELHKGASELNNGIGKSLDGFKDLKKGSITVNQGINQLQNGANQLSTGAKKLTMGVAKTTAGSEQLTEGLKQYLAKHPELQTDVEFQTLVGTSAAITNGLTQLESSSGQIQGGISSIATNMSKVSDGQVKVTSGISQLQSAQAKIHEGSRSLVNGSQKLADGNSTLNNGWSTVVSSVQKIQDGEVDLVDGSKKLTTKLKDAADESKEFNPTKKTEEMFAKPVKLEKEVLHAVPNYGTGLAPYMISISLFIGALMLTIVLDIRKTPAVPKTGFGLFFSKLTTLVIVGCMQSLIVDAVLIKVVGLHVKHLGQFVGLTLLTSITFIALIQMLVKPLGNVGRFLAVVILISQITSTGGTFPIELIPEQLHVIHNWLPMTYSIEAFRAAISSDEATTIANSIHHLLAFFGTFALITWLYAFVRVRVLKKTVE